MQHPKGATLIELLIYMAIVGLVIGGLVRFSVSITETRNKNYAIQEVNENLRRGMQEISSAIRRSSAIVVASSTFGIDPGTLVLSMSSSTLNPTIIQLNTDDGALVMKQGSMATSTITSNAVAVTELLFSNTTHQSSRESVRIRMTVEKIADSADFEFIQSAQTAVTTRY